MRRGLGCPVFMGPTGLNSDMNVSGTVGERRLLINVRRTLGCSSEVILRGNVGTERVRITIVKGRRIGTSVTNRVGPTGSFCSCRSGCVGNASACSVPTGVGTRSVRSVEEVTVRTFGKVSKGKLSEMSFFVSGSSNRVFVGRVGALPKFAGVDVCPGV